MKGWVIYRDDATQLRPESYEIHRLVEEAKKEGIDLEVFKPELKFPRNSSSHHAQ